MMVFRNDRQRKGFFARLDALKERHRQNVEKKLDEKVKQEKRELAQAQKTLQVRVGHQRLITARQQAIANQRKQVEDLKKASKEAKRASFALTNRGKAVAFIKKEAVQVGTGAKRVATSKTTKRFLKKVGKELGV